MEKHSFEFKHIVHIYPHLFSNNICSKQQNYATIVVWSSVNKDVNVALFEKQFCILNDVCCSRAKNFTRKKAN